MEPNVNEFKVWYVTGASTGLGLNLVKKLLTTPNTKVIATTRRPVELEKEIPVEHLPNLLITKTDITNESSVKESINAGITKFGHIDFVVNNAGYGCVGAVEEVTDEEIRKAFDVNFFGVLHVIRNVASHLRSRKQGIIFNISSILGWFTVPELYAYNSSKHALNGLSFTLGQELAPFNVKVVNVAPSGFTSSFVDTGMMITKNLIPEYKTGACTNWLDDIVNNARGNPDKFSEVLITVSTLEKTPKNIFLGTHAVQLSRNSIKEQTKEVDEFLQLSISTDYETAPKIDY